MFLPFRCEAVRTVKAVIYFRRALALNRHFTPAWILTLCSKRQHNIAPDPQYGQCTKIGTAEASAPAVLSGFGI